MTQCRQSRYKTKYRDTVYRMPFSGGHLVHSHDSMASTKRLKYMSSLGYPSTHPCCLAGISFAILFLEAPASLAEDRREGGCIMMAVAGGVVSCLCCSRGPENSEQPDARARDRGLREELAPVATTAVIQVLTTALRSASG